MTTKSFRRRPHPVDHIAAAKDHQNIEFIHILSRDAVPDDSGENSDDLAAL